jgi:chromosome segregation ATPase
MKIFYKKDFQRVLKSYKELKEEFEGYKEKTNSRLSELDARNYELFCERSDLQDRILGYETSKAEYDNEISVLKINIEELKAEIKEKEKEKDKLEKKIAKLEDVKIKKETEISDLKAEIADLRSDRYRVRTIPAGRTKNVNKTSIRSSARESRVIKYVKDNL